MNQYSQKVIRIGNRSKTLLYKRLYTYNPNAFLKPVAIILANTNRCNHKCRHCDSWKNSINSDDLSGDELKKQIGQILSWVGPFHLCLSGGEPLLRNDSIDLMRYCIKNQVAVLLNTNGYLIDNNMAREIVRSGIQTVTVSLYALNSKIHDEIRQVQGAWNKVMAGITYLRKWRRVFNSRLKIRLGIIVSELNLNELGPLLDWARGVNISVVYQAVYKNFFSPSAEPWKGRQDMWPSKPSAVLSIIDRLILLKKKGYPIENSMYHLIAMKAYFADEHYDYKCRAGVSNCIIDGHGDVWLCYLSHPVGNIQQASLKQIWYSVQAQKMRQKLHRCNQSCGILNCNFDEKTLLERCGELYSL